METRRYKAGNTVQWAWSEPVAPALHWIVTASKEAGDWHACEVIALRRGEALRVETTSVRGSAERVRERLLTRARRMLPRVLGAL